MYGIIRSGMSTAMHEIAVVSNNIANSGSTGFKKSDVSFNDIYGSATPDTVARTQAGFGSAIAGTRRNDGQGAIVDRAGALNLAIIGPGMLTVSPPGADGAASGNLFYTRSGELTIDKDGYLKTGDGAFVQGTAAGVEVGGTLSALQIPFNEGEEALTGLEITTKWPYLGNLWQLNHRPRHARPRDFRQSRCPQKRRIGTICRNDLLWPTDLRNCRTIGLWHVASWCLRRI